MAAVSVIDRLLCSCSQLRGTGQFLFQSVYPQRRFHKSSLISKRYLHFTRWKFNRFANDPLGRGRSVNYRGKILKPVLFTCLVGVSSFGAASILQYEKLRHDMKHGNIYPRWFSERSEKEFSLRKHINQWWNRLCDGKKVVAGIIAVNAGVFVCWRIPAFRHFLTTWFTAHPAGGRSLPMLLSCFSHAELWHFGCNMVVLWSFAPAIVDILGLEQFLAFYITGGVVSSLASHFYKTIARTPSFSLGASGAILAVLAAVCVERPEARLSIIFLPFFSFSATTALLGILALDFTGLVLRWQLFDHAAHLGGALFGIWYSKYGERTIWQQRGSLVRQWHNFRKGKD